jgi:hypothetical protein
MRSKQNCQRVLETLKELIHQFAPTCEFEQLSDEEWTELLSRSRSQLVRTLRDSHHLAEVDALSPDWLQSFESTVLHPIHEHLFGLFFKALYWHLDEPSLGLLQFLLTKWPDGSGSCSCVKLQREFAASSYAQPWRSAFNDLLKFRFNFFGEMKPLINMCGVNDVEFLLASNLEFLCQKFCCHPRGVLDMVRNQLLAERAR